MIKGYCLKEKKIPPLLERMEKEAEEERMRKQKAASERAFQDGIAKAKLVMRRTPLGTDRNHNRLVFHTHVYSKQMI